MTEDDTFDALRRPPTEDEIYFGRKRWIYCDQHLNYHRTGLCSVPISHKFGLKATTAEEAHAECEARGFTLFRYR